MFRGFLYHGDSNILTALSQEQIDACKLPSDEADVPPLCQTHSFLWIDVASPTEKEIATMCNRFRLHPQTSDDLRQASDDLRHALQNLHQEDENEDDQTQPRSTSALHAQVGENSHLRFHTQPESPKHHHKKERPKLHDYGKYIYLVFHSMKREEKKYGAGRKTQTAGESNRNGISTVKIHCLLGPDWILTLHSQPIEVFTNLESNWERGPGEMHNGPAHLLCKLMDSVLDGYSSLLENLDESIELLEEQLCDPEASTQSGKQISREIFKLKRILLSMRQIAVPTHEVVNELLRLRRDSEEGKRYSADFRHLHDHMSHIVAKIETERETLKDALDAYLGLESSYMNVVMKRLSAVSFILLPPTLIAGIFGMNFGDMADMHFIKYGFLDSIFLMGIVMIFLLLLSKWRNWL